MASRPSAAPGTYAVPRRPSPKLTPRVRQVRALLEARQRPCTAQDLHAALRAAREPTGLSTVYRALRILTDLDLVHEIALDDGTVYRACSPGIHDHLICRRCGTIHESRATRIRAWLSDLRHDGFAADGDRIDVYGICQRCTDLQS